MNFKPGDEVYVIPERAYTFQGKENKGKLVVIKEVCFHAEKNVYFITIDDNGGGIWLNEVRHLTKLERALR